MGALDHLSDLFYCTSRSKKKFKNRKQLQVKMDCEGCERKVKKAVEGMKGKLIVEMILVYKPFD
uniref:HMA domain-containing protein n=1 Tax=Nelumbo nucifera TaxID=4432 RepID=A0A822ZDA9_NELNU|nr:TPA_asm: hypothetical protein HUJ06_015994 [Nelumbo nucifera]